VHFRFSNLKVVFSLRRLKGFQVFQTVVFQKCKKTLASAFYLISLLIPKLYKLSAIRENGALAFWRKKYVLLFPGHNDMGWIFLLEKSRI